MKILILANHDLGLYKFRRELLEALVMEHEVYFCVPDGELVEAIKKIGCKYVPCNVMDRRGTNPIKEMKLLFFYKKIISDIKPDIVLTYTIKPNVYGGLVCRKKKIPYIANVTGLGTTIENGGLLALISTSLYKVGLKRACCVFFQNKNNQKMFVDKKIVKGRTKILPGSGVNLNMHYLEPYPSDAEGVRFLFVGRIMKDKGIGELISVIRELHKARKDVVLDIVGFCDEDYEDVLSIAEEEGAVINHGVQMDVHPYYKECHCTVLPSYHEGMANVMLEASATGRPVITTRVPGCQETFDEGVTGFGCEAKSADSLKEAMLQFLSLTNDCREKMGMAAREKMVQEYDRTIIVEAYKAEIEKVSAENQEVRNCNQ